MPENLSVEKRLFFHCGTKQTVPLYEGANIVYCKQCGTYETIDVCPDCHDVVGLTWGYEKNISNLPVIKGMKSEIKPNHGGQ